MRAAVGRAAVWSRLGQRKPGARSPVRALGRRTTLHQRAAGQLSRAPAVSCRQCRHPRRMWRGWQCSPDHHDWTDRHEPPSADRLPVGSPAHAPCPHGHVGHRCDGFGRADALRRAHPDRDRLMRAHRVVRCRWPAAAVTASRSEPCRSATRAVGGHFRGHLRQDEAAHRRPRAGERGRLVPLHAERPDARAEGRGGRRSQGTAR
mmetsp:Transcript_25403/g.82112  ORF Transcript_25403/g.82112 Transcript_25403/m.82112 type:complete len:205 (-) Transcript_25403:907-1521(-)